MTPILQQGGRFSLALMASGLVCFSGTTRERPVSWRSWANGFGERLHASPGVLLRVIGMGATLVPAWRRCGPCPGGEGGAKFGTLRAVVPTRAMRRASGLWWITMGKDGHGVVHTFEPLDGKTGRIRVISARRPTKGEVRDDEESP